MRRFLGEVVPGNIEILQGDEGGLIKCGWGGREGRG